MKAFACTTIILLSVALNTITNAQILWNSKNSADTPNEYYLQVKQLDEFVNRFNYSTDWKGNKINNQFEVKYPRINYLSFLINQSDLRLNNEKDSSYYKLCEQFLLEITSVNTPQFIDIYSSDVKAKTQLNVSYLGKKQTALVYFSPEVLADRSVKWVIADVKTDCFKTLTDSAKTYFLAPNSHETGFINLNKLEHLSNPIYFLPTDMANDTKLQFVTEVVSGRLVINYTEKSSFEITFPNWLITIEEFNRSNYNSGWLISNIIPIDN